MTTFANVEVFICVCYLFELRHKSNSSHNTNTVLNYLLCQHWLSIDRLLIITVINGFCCGKLWEEKLDFQ